MDIGCKLSIFRNKFYLDIDMHFNYKNNINYKNSLYVNELAVVNTFIALIHVRAGDSFIYHFDKDDVVNKINEMPIA